VPPLPRPRTSTVPTYPLYGQQISASLTCYRRSWSSSPAGITTDQVSRWIAGVFGRVNPQNWRREGIEPITPDGWTYHMDYSPTTTTDDFVKQVVSGCNRKMTERAFLIGDPTTVALQIQE
jgi:hypothetical protein